MKEVVTTVKRNCTHHDEGPVRPETCSSLRVLKHYSDYNEVCAFVGLQCNKNILL